MKPEYVFMLLGGLGLFLCGMQMMSSNLEAVAGDRLKGILEKLTSNRILGVLVGAVITAVIQSSSATTVMVVGFVNSGLMTLRQAVWIIMGATSERRLQDSLSPWISEPSPHCSRSQGLRLVCFPRSAMFRISEASLRDLGYSLSDLV